MKQIWQYDGIMMDSKEEVYFSHWLDEMKDAGFIEKWAYVTKPIQITPALKITYHKRTQLKTKSKEETKVFTLLHDLEYTPDFKIKWSKNGMNKLVSIMYEDGNFDPKKYFCSEDGIGGYTSLVEIKPKFDMHGKTARFSVLQKILWTFKGIFVDLIILDDLFKDTFMPGAIMDDFKYKKNPTGRNRGKKKVGDWRTDYTPKTLKQFLNEK